jgi:hypothetical protein
MRALGLRQRWLHPTGYHHSLNDMPAVRTHAMVALLVAVVLPALSAWSGRGGMAFTMFSSSEVYRMRVTVADVAGGRHAISPTGMGASVGGNVSRIVTGTESWRHGLFGPLLRWHLTELAARACATRPEAVSVEVVLDERPTLDAAVESHRAEARCR